MSAELDPVFYDLTNIDRLYVLITHSLSKDMQKKILAMNDKDFAEWCTLTEKGLLEYMLWEYRYERRN